MLPHCCQNGAKVANTIGSLVGNSSATAFGGGYTYIMIVKFYQIVSGKVSYKFLEPF